MNDDGDYIMYKKNWPIFSHIESAQACGKSRDILRGNPMMIETVITLIATAWIFFLHTQVKQQK